MKDWFKKCIWNWFFAKEKALENQELAQNLSQERRDFSSSKEFLSHQLMNAEQELTKEKGHKSSLERKVKELQGVIDDRQSGLDYRLAHGGANENFWKKYRINHEDIKTIKDKADMKIKYKTINGVGTVFPPAKINEEETAFSLFWGGDLYVDSGHPISFPMGFSLDLPRGYVAKVWTPKPLRGHNSPYAVSPTAFNSGEEIVVSAFNRSPHDCFQIRAGDRIAVLTIEKVQHVQFEEAE